MEAEEGGVMEEVDVGWEGSLRGGRGGRHLRGEQRPREKSVERRRTWCPRKRG